MTLWPDLVANTITTPCANCQERPGTLTWAADGGVLGFVHGRTAWWCERCVVKAQLDHALDCAAAIPDLTQRYLDLSATKDQ